MEKSTMNHKYLVVGLTYTDGRAWRRIEEVNWDEDFVKYRIGTRIEKGIGHTVFYDPEHKLKKVKIESFQDWTRAVYKP